MSRNIARGIPASSFFTGRSFTSADRQVIPIVAAGVLQPPVRVPVDSSISRCPICGVAVHASESDDEGRCEKCAGPTISSREDDVFSQVFAATRASVVEHVGADWSPAHHVRAAA